MKKSRQRANAKGAADWRLSVSMDKLKNVRKRFDTAGIELQILCFNMTQAITDDEIDYAFQMAKALGARAISSTTQVSVSKRIGPFADKHKMMIGFHGHDASDDRRNSRLRKASPRDVLFEISRREPGHWTFHGGELRRDRLHQTAPRAITNLHLKDRKKDHGPNVPWGEGDSL